MAITFSPTASLSESANFTALRSLGGLSSLMTARSVVVSVPTSVAEYMLPLASVT